MPIYEFRCNSCEKEFEELVRGGAAPSCPTCSSQDVARLLSSFAVHAVAAKPCGTGACSDWSGCPSAACAACD